MAYLPIHEKPISFSYSCIGKYSSPMEHNGFEVFFSHPKDGMDLKVREHLHENQQLQLRIILFNALGFVFQVDLFLWIL